MLGAGTSASPWQVADYDDLKKVGRGYDAGDDETYALNDWYILTADIDASASETENGTGDPVVYAGWDPIGPNFDDQFTGVLDGDGHSITGLYMNRPALRYAGLFGRMGVNPSFSSDGRGIVRNLSIVDADMTGSRSVGILSGDYNYSDTFALESSDNSGIYDVFVSGSMTVTGSASSDQNSGSLVGSNFEGVARNCTALVDVTFNRASGARRTGAMFDAVSGDISDCRFIGSMTFNTTTSADIGGFARRVNTGGVVNNCYSVCQVTGAANANGFAVDGGGTAPNSFWDTDVGPTASGLATGKTTAAMKDIDTYTDTATVGLTTAWDMTTEALHDGDPATATWFIDDGVDYPRLWFEYEAAAGDTDALTGADLTSGTPTLDTPTIEQTHAISGADLTSGTPTLDAPTVGQTHVLTGADLTSGVPTLDTPTLAEGTDNLTGADITSGTPTLDAPTIAQTHAITGANLTSGAPTLDTPTLVSVAGMDALTGADVTSGTPTIDVPTLGQVHILTGTDILGGVSIDSPALGQAHILTGGDLTAGVPTISDPIMDAATYNELYEIAVEWSQDLQIKAAWSSALEIAAKWEAQ